MMGCCTTSPDNLEFFSHFGFGFQGKSALNLQRRPGGAKAVGCTAKCWKRSPSKVPSLPQTPFADHNEGKVQKKHDEEDLNLDQYDDYKDDFEDVMLILI